MNFSVLRLRTEPDRKKRLTIPLLVLLLCLPLAACEGRKPDLSRDGTESVICGETTAKPFAGREEDSDRATESEKTTESVEPTESDSRPAGGGILTADPDANHFTPYY